MTGRRNGHLEPMSRLEIEDGIAAGGRGWLERELTRRELAIRRGTSAGAAMRATVAKMRAALLELHPPTQRKAAP